MNKRELLKLSLFTVIIGAPFVLEAKDKQKSRPNIIFLLTDDQRDNTFSAMGHPIIKTPTIDKLIQEGVRFSNTYIAEPTSSPSRAALLTGMHERVSGVGFTSSYQLNEEQWEQSYPTLLKRAGYYTGFIGKFGLEYYTFTKNIAQEFDVWYAHNGWSSFYAKDAQYKDAKENIITRIMGDGIVEFIENTPNNKPFCLSVSFSAPHGSTTNGMGSFAVPANKDSRLENDSIYGGLYRNSDIEISEDTESNPYEFIPQRLLDQTKGRINTYSQNYNKETCIEHHIRYYQLISGVDAAVKEMVEALKKQGLDKNTIIIFASDHGLLMGEYGMGGKALLYDLTSKIPCFVYDPRLPKNQRGKNIDQLISSLDITSTILNYAEVKQPQNMSGMSLVPLVEGEPVDWREYLFLENLYTGRDTPFQEGIRFGKWKYIRMYDGVEPYGERNLDFTGRKPDFEQLFDLEKDPKEKNNLIFSHENTKNLSLLRKMCQDESVKINKDREVYKKAHSVTKKHSL